MPRTKEKNMNNNVKRNQIAFRCHGCGTATVGFLGGLALVTDMLRLKCECGGSALDIQKQDGGKVRLSVPCIYCKDEHSYTLSQGLLTRDVATKLSCPQSGMNILYVSDESEMSGLLAESERDLARVLTSFEAEDIKDIQPQDVGEAESSPDPTVFDTLNFLVNDLREEGAIACPCGKGGYALRYCEGGMEVYCEKCGASYTFYATSMSSAEEYLSLDKIKLG